MDISYVLEQALAIFYGLITTLILVRCLLSWFPINRNNIIIRFIYNLTEPILGPIRNLLNNSPLGGGFMIDFSPIVAYIVIDIVYRVLVSLVRMF